LIDWVAKLSGEIDELMLPSDKSLDDRRFKLQSTRFTNDLRSRLCDMTSL